MIENSKIEKLAQKLNLGLVEKIELIKENNHVYKIWAKTGIYFLKIYTKDWYKEAENTGEVANRESLVAKILRNNSLAGVEVVDVATKKDDLIGIPYLLTKQLEGEPLTQLLKRVNKEKQSQILFTVGQYLNRVNSIVFKSAGYIDTEEGPSHLPCYHGWRHRMWTPKARLTSSMVELEKADVSRELRDALIDEYQKIEKQLSNDYLPPRFIFGDCHASHFFINQNGENWEVSGFIDTEVASGGDWMEDFLKFSIEMAREMAVETEWWEPFFKGYEKSFDLKDYKLRLLGCSQAELKWRQTWMETMELITKAKTWPEVFLIALGER